MNEYRLFINGEWVKSESKGLFPSINPFDEKKIGLFQQGNVADAKKAVDSAEKAYWEWREVPGPKRGELLFKFAQELEKRKEEFARLITVEMGKVISEARGEVQEAIDVAYYNAGEGRRLFGATTKSELRDKAAYTIRQPVGVFSCITPWNFPLAIPVIKLTTALVCGNTVVFKPSSDTPLVATKLVELLEKVGMPKGTINLITGPGETVGREVVKNRKVRGVSFTGSRETGEWITENSGVKRVCLELGGKNGIIIMDDADLKLALDGVIWGAFGTTGQRCSACSRVIIHKAVKERFEKMLVERTKKLKLGNGLRAETDVGPLVNMNAVKKSEYYVNLGRKEGAKVCCGGERKKGLGFFFEPTVLTNAEKDMKVCREEIFGPVLSIIEVKNFDEAIDAINSVEYGLTSAIYTRDISRAMKAVEDIEAGLTYVNASTIGSEAHLPFGGVKKSGNGARESGFGGIEEFTDVKTVYIDYSGKLQKAQIDLDVEKNKKMRTRKDKNR